MDLKDTGAIRAASSQQAGFTLIELMLIVVIVGILVGIALPAFQQQVLKSHRAAAISEMLTIANRQQQYLLSNRTYVTTLSSLGYTLPPDVAVRYTPTITVNTATVPTYNITFTAIGPQVKDGGPLTLNSAGSKGPADYWD